MLEARSCECALSVFIYIYSVYVCRTLRNDSSTHEEEHLGDGCSLIYKRVSRKPWAIMLLFASVLRLIMKWKSWPCSLKRGSSAVRLLGLRVRIPPRRHGRCLLWMCVIRIEVSATGPALVQGSPTDWVCVHVRDQVKPHPSTPTISRYRGYE